METVVLNLAMMIVLTTAVLLVVILGGGMGIGMVIAWIRNRRIMKEFKKSDDVS